MFAAVFFLTENSVGKFPADLKPLEKITYEGFNW
jgi:hypothetical protein